MAKRKRKITGRKIIVLVVFLAIISIVVLGLMQIKISNIYVKNNYLLSDQQIIDIAGIRDYPSTVFNPSFSIKKTLEKTNLIKSVKVYKKGFTSVYIIVEENLPIFYYQPENKTILLDGKKINDKYNVPILVNYVPDTQYAQLIKKFAEINPQIIDKISEIKYDPNKQVDPNRFLFIMSDGNYAYVTLSKISNINNYLNILENLEGKKGILYLDSGSSFTIIEN